MRVLFLDDSTERIERAYEHFDSDDLVVVVSASSAIDEISKGAFDLVMLDHDLGGETWVESGREDCGMEVVRWVVRNFPKIGCVVVHSWNTVAAPVMVAELMKAGYDARHELFNG